MVGDMSDSKKKEKNANMWRGEYLGFKSTAKLRKISDCNKIN